MALASALLPASGPSPASAQSFTSFEFSFSNPGARSLGFGGAFVALADDATAVYANPAGLVQITEPELSVEGRAWRYRTPFTRGGRAEGEPTGLGIDTEPGPLRGESRDHLSGLSYLSFVYPGGRWSLALFQHQVANFEFQLENQGVFLDGSGPAGSRRANLGTGRIDLDIVARGLALAFRATERLSFGLGLSRFEPRISVAGRDYLPDDDSLESYFGPASLPPDRLVQAVDLRWEEAAWGLSGGVLWRLSSRWTLGGLFRQTPELPLVADLAAGPAHPVLPAGFKFVDGARSAWDFPDVFALGLAYRSPDGRCTGAGEWRRIEYSSILESLLPEQRAGGVFLEDADELHLGAEYAFFAGPSVLAVRMGIWHDPDHYLDVSEPDPLGRALFTPGSDELHFAAGLGAAFRRFQVDLAADLSDRIDTVSLSVIYSLGGQGP